MTLGSLFDGISGFPLSASWAGIETKWISEIDPYCLKVSKKNFPNAIQYGDIKEIGKGRTWEPEPVAIISGGFPCQPFSVAGKQQGKEDNRYLWPEMLRVIREVKPRWVIGENVPGIINLALDEVLTSLENEGYKTETFIIPACGVGAHHKRDRVWIVANSINSGHWNKRRGINGETNKVEAITGKNNSSARLPFGASNEGLSSKKHDVANANSERLEGTEQGGNNKKEIIGREKGSYGTASERVSNGGEYWSTEPELGRVANGIPNRMDRIKSLGNAIVPQIAYEIFKAIVEIENNIKN